MGKMQENLVEMMQKFYSVDIETERISKLVLSSSEFNDEIQNVYHQLGGILNSYPVNPGRYDLVSSQLIIELDEHLHFNRYRAATLESSFYQMVSAFPLSLYKDYCEGYEKRCLTAGGYGGKWSNPSCEKQFGVGAKPKDLNGNGAPRWKQRAFYDFIKDVGCYVMQKPLVRISVYDEIETGKGRVQLFDVLNSNLSQYAERVYNFIESRDSK